MPDHEPSPSKPAPAKAFARFELIRPLGRGGRTMSWLALDPRSDQEVMLTLPRAVLDDDAALERWKADVDQATRLSHPHLAHTVEIGVHESWPYVVVDRALGQTLSERLEAGPPPSSAEVVTWVQQILDGLAFAHQAGVAHGDLQLHQVLISEQGQLRLMGLAVSEETYRMTDGSSTEPGRVDLNVLQVRRLAAERDVLAVGLVMHHLLAGAPALDEADTSKVMGLMPPTGREIIRLPWSTPHPVDDGLRAIVNRATDRQPRHRYHNARTLLSALRGWREVAESQGGGPLALLLERLVRIGHLPAGPGVGGRVARLAIAEGQRTDQMAEQVLQDMALSFELLRQVNSAMVQGSQLAGGPPVIALRRAISLLGLRGLRNAAAALRPWPGPLNEVHAANLERAMERARLAGFVAQGIRPAGYDAEVVYLVTLLQNLGRLLVQYHFPDEAEQIRELMLSAPPEAAGDPEQHGMGEDQASYTVLGVDIEGLGAAVARHWGLHEDLLQMIRRLPAHRPVRSADTDIDVLRLTCSAANEIVDMVSTLPATKVGPALVTVATRYARVIDLGASELGDALQAARESLRLAVQGAAALALRPAGSGHARPPAEPRGNSDFARFLAARHPV